jgi:hypothetical protein
MVTTAIRKIGLVVVLREVLHQATLVLYPDNTLFTRSILTVLFCLLPLATNRGTEPISLDQFKTITDSQIRLKIISEAPLDQRKQLLVIDQHLRLLGRFQDEAGIINIRKMLAVRTRGFHGLASLVPIQTQVWDLYIGATFLRNKAAGMKGNELIAANAALEQQKNKVAGREGEYRELLYNLAPSPAVLELNAKAEALFDKWQDRVLTSARHPLITEAERTDFDKAVDEIMEKLRTLPKLSPEQVQKEFDAATEDQIWIPEGLD